MTDGTSLRTVGVAIPIPEPHAMTLQTKRAEFNDPLATAIPAHVTLLGPTVLADGAQVAGLVEHLAQVAAEASPFLMVLRGTGTFRPVSDVVFVQIARGIASCERLEQRIRSGDFARELAFPYHPHVTVAHDVADADLDRAFDELAGYQASFQVERFCLYEQGADGRWSAVESFPLAGGPEHR